MADQQSLNIQAPLAPADGGSGESVADDVPNGRSAEGKRGSLHGGALTGEALDSSRRVLTAARGNKHALIGLQQYFTPPEAADLIAAVFGSGHSAPPAVLDPTAGSGSLLAPYPAESRFGVEIDRDHLDGEQYDAIAGDAQKVAPMMRAAGLKFPAVALNPPFGLTWRDGAHGKGEISSTALSYLWALDLLEPCGQGALICGTDRLAREVLSRPEGQGIYAVVDVEGSLFEGVALPTSIAFFVRPAARRDLRYIEVGEDSDLRQRFSASREGLPGLAEEVRAARRLAAGYVSTTADLEELARGFRAVGAEHSRRRSEAQKGRSGHDLDLRGGKVSVGLRAYSKLVLAEKGRLREVQTLSGQHPAYFGHNRRAWKGLREAEQDGLLSISPALWERAEAEIADAERTATPLFRVPPQMRLGWLTDQERIRCKKGDPEYGFVAGEDYRLSTRSKVASHTEKRPVEDRNGEPELRQFTVERRLLEVRIGEHAFDESPESISYITDRFELPDPGDVATCHPEEVARNRSLLDEMESEIRTNHDRYMRHQGLAPGTDFEPFSYKEFQKDHMSRLLVKGRGMLAHEQGLGKSLQQMSLAEAQVRLGAKNQVLFVVPQDLIPQMQRESQKFFGRRMEEVRNPAQARDVARRVKAGEEGWWITYYEALSVVGRKKESLPEQFLDHRAALRHRLVEYKRANGSPATVPEVLKAANPATTRDACPACGADTSQGWEGESCPGCCYVHRSLHRKAAYTHLTTAFKDGVTCVDEVSEIRGDDSLRSKAVRALSRGPRKWGATGTPMSNFLSDSFWGLLFTLGASSTAFPYGHDGKGRFETDFCSIEYMHGRAEDGEDHLKKRRKVLPQITNVSQFWRLAQPGVSRCRKEQTGESLVERVYHPVRVPLGVAQKRAHDFWLQNFTEYFEWAHPGHPLIEAGLVEKFAAALGQLWRLESAATLPAADAPSKEWPVAGAKLGELSNYTPANLKVLELAIEHAEKGEKVLIGSDLILTGKWLAERLCEKGIKAVHITEEAADGSVGTKNPRKRAREVHEFVSGDAQVLCSGVGAMKLGHDLAVASTVITTGLPWSWMALDQFLARVHRLTSKRDVSVYVVIPKGSLSERKWSLLRDKGASSDLAYDGELKVQPEAAIDWQKVLKDMRNRGIRSAEGSDELVDEADVEAAFERLAPVAFTPAPTVGANGAAHLLAPPWPEVDSGGLVQADLFAAEEFGETAASGAASQANGARSKRGKAGKRTRKVSRNDADSRSARDLQPGLF